MFEVWFAADLYLASGPTVKNPAGFTPEKMLKYISAGLPICGLPHNFKELPVPWHPPEFDLDQQIARAVTFSPSPPPGYWPAAALPSLATIKTSSKSGGGSA